MKSEKFVSRRAAMAIAAAALTLAVILTAGGFLAANYGFFSGGTNAPSVPEDTMTRGLVGYWSMDEGSGQYAYDGSNNGNNGTLGASSSAGSDDPKWGKGKNGGGMEFDGEDDYVNCGDDDSLDITDAITIEAWVKPEGTGNYETITAKGTWDIDGYWTACNSDSRILWYIFGVEKWAFSATANLYDGKWHHVIFTYDKDGGTNNHKFYVDGSIDTQKTNTGQITVSIGDNQYIGQNNDGGTKFSGSIDEVRIYNRALTADEVRYHYNRGGPVASWNFDEGSGTDVYDSSGNEFHGTLTP